MSVTTDVINLNVNINGDAAKAQLNQLRTEAARITGEMKNLKKGTTEWLAKQSELGLINERMKSLRSQIGLTALSQKELAAELKRLQQLKLNLTPQTKEFNDLQKQIDAVQDRLKEVRTGEFGFKKFWSSMSAEVKQFGVLAAGYLGFDFLIGQTKNIIHMQTKMADEYSNIEKTTSLTTELIKSLDKELRKLDTRTSYSRLRDLAAEAGKLGKDGVNDLSKFVEEADTIDVALGEDLGEEGLLKIAKLSGILKEGMINIASGINAVGSASAASEAYQVDFAFRMSGTAQTARIAAGDLLGYAAALEVNGQTAEVAGTALSTFFMDFIKDSENFGKAAGYASGELTKLIADEGVNKAFLTWLQRMKDMSATEAEFMRNMNQIGIDGARGAGVFLVMANNLGMIAEQQAIANEAVREGTSVVDEFNTKNQNFAAVVEKLNKEFNAFFTSDSINAGVKTMVGWFTNLLHAVRDVVDWVIQHKTAVTAWLVAGALQMGLVQKLVGWIALQVTGTRAATLAQIAQTVATKADIVATTALSAIKALLVGNIAKVRQELKLLFATMGANPWAAALVVIGALLVAFDSLISKTQKLTATEQLSLDLNKRIADSTAEKTTKIKNLVAAINDENTAEDKKKRLLEQLIALDPAMLSGLTQKNLKTSEGEQIIRSYIKAMEDAVKAEALFSMQVDVEKKIRSLELEAKSYDKLWKSYNEGVKGLGKAIWDSSKNMLGFGPLADWEKLQEEMKEAKAMRDELQKEAKQSINTPQYPDDKPLVGGTSTAPISTGKSGGSSGDQSLRELAALRTEMDKIAQDIQKKKAEAEGNLSAMHVFELEALVEKYGKLLTKAKAYGTTVVAELADLKEQEIALLLDKQFSERAEQEYNDSLKAFDLYLKQQEQLTKQGYADGTISTKEYNAQMEHLKRQELEGRLKIHKDYAETVKKAADQVEKAETDVLEKGIQDREQLIENSIRNRLAHADYKIATAPVNSKEQLQAIKDRLQLERDLRVENENLTAEEIAVIDAKLKEDLEAADAQYWKNKADMIIWVFARIADLANNIFAIANNKGQKDLNEEKARNEEKAKNYKKQLDAKQISQEQYDAAMDNMNAVLEKKQIEFNQRKAKRDKASALFSAIISTAQAVAGQLSMIPVTPLNIVLAGVMAALGGAQIAAIATQPLPQARKGLIVSGPSHETGGIDLVNNQTGERIAEMEGGEPIMILSKDTYRNNKDIVDQLIHNSQNKNGAKISTNWYMKPQRQMNAKAIDVMRDGSINARVQHDKLQATEQELAQNNALLQQLVEEQRLTRSVFAKQKPIKAYVTLKDIQDQTSLVDKAKGLSGIR